MRCLWIGRESPYPPQAGDLIYSSRLIESFAAAGAEVTALYRASPFGDVELPPGVTWRMVESRTRSAASSLVTRMPNIAHRFATRALRSALAAELKAEWDVIVLDHVGAGWALPQVQRRLSTAPRTKLAYVSHNHEGATRALIARNSARHPLVRVGLIFDAWKAGRLERRLVAAADLITAITQEDLLAFEHEVPDTRSIVLTPGYLDRVVNERTLTDELPRRAVIVGSFDWLPKRMNLEEFLEVADPIFERAGAELLVVGRGPEAWLDQLRARSRATRFTGTVNSVVNHLDDARVGVICERSGGGFKLKVLHYVFNRIPVAALEGSLSGVPLIDGKSFAAAPTQLALAQRVIDLLDDVDHLNELQRRAFEACADQFDWETRGRDLHAALQVAVSSGHSQGS